MPNRISNMHEPHKRPTDGKYNESSMSFSGSFVSEPIPVDLGPQGLNFKRADIEISGLDQSGPSFEGRVFLNNPGADVETPLEPENGYAGSFHVFGYGIWPEDVPEPAPRPQRSSEGVRAPITKDVIATDAVRAAAAKNPAIVVTIVPVFRENAPAATLKTFHPNVKIVVH
jgi:hypothetical protein